MKRDVYRQEEAITKLKEIKNAPNKLEENISTIKSDLKKDEALLDARQESRESCDRTLAYLTASQGLGVSSLKDKVEAKARQIAFQKEQMTALAAKIKNNATETESNKDSNAALEKEVLETHEVAATATELVETTAARADAKMREMMREQTLLNHVQETQAVQDGSLQKLDAFKSQAAELQHREELQEAKEVTATATELPENAGAQDDTKMHDIRKEQRQAKSEAEQATEVAKTIHEHTGNGAKPLVKRCDTVTVELVENQDPVEGIDISRGILRPKTRIWVLKSGFGFYKTRIWCFWS